MLAFKIMNDPFVGSLTFAVFTQASWSRVQFVPEFCEREERAHRSDDADALQFT
jgi:hypothetical protein